MSTRSPETVVPFPTRPTEEKQPESPDSITLRHSLDWVEYFVANADRDAANGMYRRLGKFVERLEHRHGFGKKS